MHAVEKNVANTVRFFLLVFVYIIKNYMILEVANFV